MANRELKKKLGFDSSYNGMNFVYDKLSQEDQTWCKKSLEKLKPN